MEQDTDKRLLNILRKAIQSERIAYKRYKLCCSYCVSDDEKKLFDTLAEEELKHEELISRWMRDLKKKIGLKVMKKEEEEEAPKKSKKTKKKEQKKET